MPEKSASSRSSSRWGSNVPQMKRTDAVPAPYRRRPSIPASTTSGRRREPEVVVRREHEHLAAALHLHDGALRRDEDVRGLVGAGLAEPVELRAERLVEPGARDAHLCVHLPGPDEASTGSRAGAWTCCGADGRPPG